MENIDDSTDVKVDCNCSPELQSISEIQNRLYQREQNGQPNTAHYDQE